MNPPRLHDSEEEMSQFQMRADNVEISGKVINAWYDPWLYNQPQTYDWHVIVQLASGDPRLVTADGRTNVFDWIECRVTPIAPYRGLPYAGQLLSEVIGQKVRIAGSWGDLTDGVGTGATQIWPISWMVVDRGVVPLVEEHGFTQGVRDVDLFAFSDDSDVPLGGTPPPHHRENRHLEVRIPFPVRPQSNAIPMHTDCVDREAIEKVTYFGSTVAQPSFPYHKENQFSSAVENAAGADTLVVTIDTGLPVAGNGFSYAKMALTYDEGFDTLCDPNVCLLDPGQSCQPTGEDRLTYVWPSFTSARSGDLLLGPAGPHGVLGHLLGALHGPQYYDHMVMFVEDDGRTTRHCTASDDRIQDKEYYSSTVKVETPLGDIEEKLPLEGIRGDILRYAWPGTITQTIGEVCITGRNRSNPEFGFAQFYPNVIAQEVGNPPRLWELAPAERAKRSAFHDPEAAGTAKRLKDAKKRKTYGLVRLQKDPAWRPEINPNTGNPVGYHFPVLVQPHPFLANVAHEALLVVAAEAKKIRAHYRFFSYSDGSIVTDPTFNAPPAGSWGSNEGVDWAADTVAAVCSSYPAGAVYAANMVLQAANKPVIELEGEIEPTDMRLAASPDGMYVYTEEERREAAKALFEFTYKRVTDELDKKIEDLPGVVDALLGLLSIIPGTTDPVDVIKNYFGTVVANQLCNIFAADATSDFVDTWSSTPPGKAVSPDDTMLRWDTDAPLDTFPPVFQGKVHVYGNQFPVAIPRPRWTTEPIYRILPTTGIGSIAGIVVRRFRPDEEPSRVVGAVVRFGCQSIATDPEGSFGFSNVKAGTYTLQAAIFVVDKETNVGTEWKSRLETITLSPGDMISGIVLELFPPPGLARDVTIRSHHDIVDRRTVGKDAWGHFDLNGAIPLAFDPLNIPTLPPEQQSTKLSDVWDQTTPEVGSGVHVQVKVKSHLKEIVAPDGSISFDGTVVSDITLVFFDADEGETNDTITDLAIELPLGASHTLPYNVVSDDTVPERASGSVTISNVYAVLA
jgi:hypothetical protein